MGWMIAQSDIVRGQGGNRGGVSTRRRAAKWAKGDYREDPNERAKVEESCRIYPPIFTKAHSDCMFK